MEVLDDFQDTISEQQAVKITFTVKNSGSAFAGASTAYIYDGNKKLGQVSVASLSAGNTSNTYTYTIAAGNFSVGTHTLKVVADAANSISESNESNNTRTCSVTVTAISPDLVVSAIKPASSKVKETDKVKLSFTIKNEGKATAAASTAYIYDGSTKIGYANVSSLAAGKKASFTLTVAAGKLSAGVHTLKVVADAAYSVSESNESNNTKSCSVTVTAVNPDLVVSSLSATTSSSIVSLKFSIKNKGKAYAGTCRAYIYDGSTYLGSISIASLNAGKTSSKYTYSIATSRLTAGKHTFKVVVDATGLVEESNENNNTLTKKVTVKKSSSYLRYAANDYATVLEQTPVLTKGCTAESYDLGGMSTDNLTEDQLKIYCDEGKFDAASWYSDSGNCNTAYVKTGYRCELNVDNAGYNLRFDSESEGTLDVQSGAGLYFSGTVDFGSKNDTVIVGNEAELCGTRIDFGGGEDILTIGKNAHVEIEKLTFEDDGNEFDLSFEDNIMSIKGGSEDNSSFVLYKDSSELAVFTDSAEIDFSKYGTGDYRVMFFEDKEKTSVAGQISCTI